MKLIYQLETADTTHYQLYIKEDYLDKLEIPDEIKDRISSVSVTFPEADESVPSVISRHLVGETICGRIQEVLEAYWNFDYGIPVIGFAGYTNKLSDSFRNRSIVIYFVRDIKDNYIWDRQLSFITKFTFLANKSEFGYEINTTDIDFIHSFIQKRITIGLAKPISNKLSAEYKMKVWFPDDEEREEILYWAKATIDKFVIEKNYNIYIPEYAAIHSSHIRRYKTITDMFRTKYGIDLVMSLPMLLNKTYYTVMFPVCGSLNKKNVKGY